MTMVYKYILDIEEGLRRPPRYIVVNIYNRFDYNKLEKGLS